MNETDDKIPSYQYDPQKVPEPYPSPPDQHQIFTQEYEMRLKKEIDELKRKIGRFFTVYEVRAQPEAIAFYCRVIEDTLEENFELLRNILKPNYIPLLTYEAGEHVIYVMKKPQVKYKGTRVNLILLIITLITTTIAGSFLWAPYHAAYVGKSTSDMDVLASTFSPENLLYGALFFSLPLIAILGIHESAHYLMAKRHGVAASLPFFIPMIPPLGTLGAVISMREPIPNKKALMDIGAAGPIAGLLVAIPVTIIGLILTQHFHAEAMTGDPGGMVLYNPLLIIGLGSAIPSDPNLLAHPTFFAGWVGILVTALNLLPAGQLDGGHIVRALFGENTRYIGISTVLIMIILAFWFNYFGFVFLIVIVMFLGGGLSHPPPLNDITKLDRRRVMVGVVALVIFVVSFHPAPFQSAEIPEYGFELSPELNETVISPGGFVEFNVTVWNTGEVENDVFLSADMNQTRLDEGWNVTLTWIGEEETKIYNITEDELELLVDDNKTEIIIVRVTSPSTASIGENVTVTLNMRWNSWKRDDVGDVIKKTKRTYEDIIVRVE